MILNLRLRGLFIDTVNNSQKRGLFEKMEVIRSIRDLRNEIVHEYLEEELEADFSELLKLTPQLTGTDNLKKPIQFRLL